MQQATEVGSDMERIAKELTERRYRSDLGLKVKTGIYGLHVIDGAALPAINLPQGALIYIGMTAGTAGERDHFEYRHSGYSSPRRSLGALLGLCAMRRGTGKSSKNWQNYRFSDDDEVYLSRWMKKHLLMNSVQILGDAAEIKEVERQLIERFKPPLNLDGKGATTEQKLVATLREACRLEARRVTRQ